MTTERLANKDPRIVIMPACTLTVTPRPLTGPTDGRPDVHVQK
jgi:hypothetical protein